MKRKNRNKTNCNRNDNEPKKYKEKSVKKRIERNDRKTEIRTE